jgi:hypothetical protein
MTLVVATVLVTPPEVRGDFDRATGKWVGDVSARNFSEYCSGELPSKRRSKFSAALDTADRALASRNLAAARDAFSEAREAAYRGGADSDLSIKCFGESVARRWFKAQLELNRQRSAIDSRGSEDEMAALYVSAADQGAKSIIRSVEGMKPRRFVTSVGTLEGIVDRIDNEREFGAFILTEEDALEKACRQALRSLRQRAAQEHQSALLKEEQTFSRPITDQELAASNAVENAQGLAKAVTGVDVGATWDRDEIILRKRAGESQDLLRMARVWNLEIYEDRRTMPSSLRARKRGDEMLSKAEDTSASLPLRDTSYREAQRYYDFGGFKEASVSAASARVTIQAALQAERDRQAELLDQAEARLNEKAESVRQAAESMEKSDSEKKVFKKEADALEDELGF